MLSFWITFLFGGNTMRDNKQLFNDWASSYDDSVKKSDQNNTYPFAGYSLIQEMIYKKIVTVPNLKILEMGIGTGRMTFKLYNSGYEITGVDSSSKMIEKSKILMPLNKYINKDFLKVLPELNGIKYDVIIFAYSIHHLMPINQKYLLDMLSNNLNPYGCIIIGDVMTRTSSELDSLAIENSGIWDEEEFYPTLEDYNNKVIKQFYDVEFTKVSFCSGIMTLRKKTNKKGDNDDK